MRQDFVSVCSDVNFPPVTQSKRTISKMMKRTFLVPVLLFALLGSGYRQQPDFDILIRNGRVVDGTGNLSFIGDVGIRDGKIAAIGRLNQRTAARTIDAQGLA